MLLKREPVDRALVFTRTKHGADRVVRGLVRAGIAAEAIHGNKSQGQRDRVMAAFRSGGVRTLVATDIAARGIDVDGISHVINFDLPNIAGELRPPHRAHRARRCGGHRHLAGQCRRDRLHARHRKVDPPADCRIGHGRAFSRRPERDSRRRRASEHEEAAAAASPSRRQSGIGEERQQQRPAYGAPGRQHANGLAGARFLEPARRGPAAQPGQ